jgi:hypothetical protein
MENRSTGLQEGSHTDEDADRVLAARSFDGHPTGIEARRAVFLIGSVVLFIHNEQAQLRTGHEDGPPPSGSQPVTGRHPEPARRSFPIALGTIEPQATREGRLQSVQNPGAVVHLRDDDDRGTGCSSSRADELRYEPASIRSRQGSETPHSGFPAGDRIGELSPTPISEQRLGRRTGRKLGRGRRLNAYPGWNDAFERGGKWRSVTLRHPRQEISQGGRRDRSSKHETSDRFESFLSAFGQPYNNTSNLPLAQRDPHEGTDFYDVS